MEGGELTMRSDTGAVLKMGPRLDDEIVEMDVIMKRLKHSTAGDAVAAVLRYKKNTRNKRKWREGWLGNEI